MKYLKSEKLLLMHVHYDIKKFVMHRDFTYEESDVKDMLRDTMKVIWNKHDYDTLKMHAVLSDIENIFHNTVGIDKVLVDTYKAISGDNLNEVLPF